MSGPDVVAAVNRGAQAAAGKSAEHAQLAEIIGELVGPVQSGEGLQSRLRGVRISSTAPVIDLPGERNTLIAYDDTTLYHLTMHNEIAPRSGNTPQQRKSGGGLYQTLLKPTTKK